MSKIPELANIPEISFIDDRMFEDVRKEMFDDYQQEYLRLTNEWDPLVPASRERLILLSSASQIYQAMQCIDRAGKASMLKYSYGADLDNLAAMYGLMRGQPRGARVTLRFTLSGIRASATPIPGGTRVKDAKGTCFYTSSYTEVPSGALFADIAAIAEKTGTEANGVLPGELDRIVDPQPYVASVTNTEPSAGGSDMESDDSLTLQIWNAPARYSTAGAEASYAYWIREFGRGIETFKTYSPAPSHDTVLVLMQGGVAPSQALITELQEYLSGHSKRPLCDRLTVAAPTEVRYNINLTYYISRENISAAEHIQQAVIQAVNDYVDWQRQIGLDIIPDELIRRMREAGAKRAAVVAPVYTVVTPYNVPLLGTKTVDYGGLEDA